MNLVYMCAFIAIGFILERMAPVMALTVRDRLLNCTCGVLFSVVDVLLAFYVSYAVAPLIRHPLISVSLSDHHWFVFSVLLSLWWLLMRDFFYYWFHRWQHASKWLWAEHALHHSDTALNVTTAVRHHWLEIPFNLLFVATPLLLLFKPPSITVPLTYLMTYFVGYLIHCNVRLGSGSLAKVFVSPHNHRIHHSREARHIDKNFAQFFPLWDVIFGTYYQPAADEFPETGLASGETVTSLSQAAWMPFAAWRAMLAGDEESPSREEMEIKFALFRQGRVDPVGDTSTLQAASSSVSDTFMAGMDRIASRASHEIKNDMKKK